MARFVGAAEAARLLGVQRATLYAYVSRGLVERRVAVDGRTSLYALADVEALAGRVRRRDAEPRPSLDVQIVSGVTTLDESGVRYRGHDVADLARRCSFEQVAELLWRGALPPTTMWPDPSPADLRRAGRVTRAVGGGGGVAQLVAVASALGVHHPADDPATAAQRLLGVAPTVLAGGSGALGSAVGIAGRLAAAWQPEPHEALGAALDRALVLLADHELATSTLAVRIAGSTWTGPYPAFACGLATVQGPLHGGAAAPHTTCSQSASETAPQSRSPAACRPASGSPASGTRSTRATTRGSPRCWRPSRCSPTPMAGVPSSTTCSPRPASGSLAARTSTSASAPCRSSPASRVTCRCSRWPASPASPPTSSRSSRNARSATEASPAPRVRNVKCERRRRRSVVTAHSSPPTRRRGEKCERRRLRSVSTAHTSTSVGTAERPRARSVRRSPRCARARAPSGRRRRRRR